MIFFILFILENCTFGFANYIVYSKKNVFYLKIRTIVLITIVDYPLDLRVGHKKGKQLNTNHFPFIKSGYQDSNLGPPAPKAGALTGLRYTPSCH